jgi:hypothetical protein
MRTLQPAPVLTYVSGLLSLRFLVVRWKRTLPIKVGVLSKKTCEKTNTNEWSFVPKAPEKHVRD